MERFTSRGEKAGRDDSDSHDSDEGGDGDENGDDKGDMAVQVDQFFSELDIDYSRQRKRLLTSGIKVAPPPSLLFAPVCCNRRKFVHNKSFHTQRTVRKQLHSFTYVSPCTKHITQAPRRKSLLPTHLHSVMGNANLRLARGDSNGAIDLCKEVIRQGTST